MQRRTAHASDGSDGAPARWRRAMFLACVFAATVVPAQAASALTVSAGHIDAVVDVPFSGSVGSFTDTAALGCSAPASYSATITWADHSTSAATIGAADRSGFNCTYALQGGHTFGAADNESFHLAVTSGGTTTTTADGTVTVTSPSVALTAVPASGVEVRTLSATLATFTSGNPNATADEFSASVTWGDGSPTAGAVVTKDPSGAFGVFASHAFASPGNYSATVAITDGGAAAGSASVPVTIADAALTSAGAHIDATEGAPFSAILGTLDDADTSRAASYYSGNVTWGDGQTSTAVFAPNPSGGFFVEASHRYADQGSYTASFTVTDPGGQTTAATSSVTVADAALSATGLVVSATEGAPFNAALATFTDADTGRLPSHYTASVSWGDGSAVSGGAISADGSGGFAVVSGHDFARPGSYPVTVTIADPGGQTTTQASVVVVDAPLTAVSTGQLQIIAGTLLQANFATFTDADPAGAAADYRATIDWGDGSMGAATVAAGSNGGFVVSATHVYTAAGTFTTTTTIVDNDGGSTAQASGSVVVNALPPPPPPPPPVVTTTTPVVTTTPTKAVAAPLPQVPPVLSVSTPRLISSNAFSLRLVCPQTAGHCRGVARVVTLAPRARSSPLRGGTTLGSTVFVLSAGESRTLKITVPSRLRSVLRKARSARLAGVAIAYGASGRTAATTGPTAVVSTARVH